MQESLITGRIDVHCHLLPGVDDGCANVEQSIDCARRLAAAGYTHAFCTPHIWPNLQRNTMQNITAWTADLQRALDAAGVALRVMPGGEINLNADYASRTDPAQVVTYGGARRFAIFDLWADRLPPHFEPSVRWLQSLGLTVILAHPERMRAVQDQPELADYFAELGLLLQGNLQCFGDPPHADTRRTAERFLAEGRYFCLGSDTHGPDSLDLRLRGLAAVVERFGSAVADRLTIDNPRRLM